MLLKSVYASFLTKFAERQSRDEGGMSKKDRDHIHEKMAEFRETFREQASRVWGDGGDT